VSFSLAAIPCCHYVSVCVSVCVCACVCVLQTDASANTVSGNSSAEGLRQRHLNTATSQQQLPLPPTYRSTAVLTYTHTLLTTLFRGVLGWASTTRQSRIWSTKNCVANFDRFMFPPKLTIAQFTGWRRRRKKHSRNEMNLNYRWSWRHYVCRLSVHLYMCACSVRWSCVVGTQWAEQNWLNRSWCCSGTDSSA